jgi:type IV secretion system protein TrbB
MPRRTIIDDRLDGHIRRIGAGRKVQAVLCVEPLGDDGYAISIPA